MNRFPVYAAVERRWTVLVLVAAAAITAITFLRFVGTPLGLGSLGRDWGYFVSYTKFGFIHRGFIGTILTPFRPAPLANDHLLPLLLFPAFLVATAVAALLYVRRLDLPQPQQNVYLAAILLSPAFIAHYAYSTGDFNVILALIFICTMILIRNFVVVVGLLLIAMLIHEIYLMAFVPAICVALYDHSGRRLGKAALFGAVALSIMAIIMKFGAPNISHADYLSLIHQQAPNIVADGYEELTNSLTRNLELAGGMYRDYRLWALVIPAILYWGLVVAMFFPRSAGMDVRALYVAASAAPYVMFPLGTDLYRWVCLGCVAALVLGGYLASRGYSSIFTRRPWLAFALLLPWIVPGPLGSACDPDRGGCVRLYPMAQFALEKIL